MWDIVANSKEKCQLIEPALACLSNWQGGDPWVDIFCPKWISLKICCQLYADLATWRTITGTGLLELKCPTVREEAGEQISLPWVDMYYCHKWIFWILLPVLRIFFLFASVQWTCTWWTTRAFLDVLARLGTSCLPMSRWFRGYLMWHMNIYRYTDYVLSWLHSLFPNLVSLSQDLPLILDNSFGEMSPHKQSAGLWNPSE